MKSLSLRTLWPQTSNYADTMQIRTWAVDISSLSPSRCPTSYFCELDAGRSQIVSHKWHKGYEYSGVIRLKNMTLCQHVLAKWDRCLHLRSSCRWCQSTSASKLKSEREFSLTVAKEKWISAISDIDSSKERTCGSIQGDLRPVVNGSRDTDIRSTHRDGDLTLTILYFSFHGGAKWTLCDNGDVAKFQWTAGLQMMDLNI